MAIFLKLIVDIGVKVSEGVISEGGLVLVGVFNVFVGIKDG